MSRGLHNTPNKHKTHNQNQKLRNTGPKNSIISNVEASDGLAKLHDSSMIRYMRILCMYKTRSWHKTAL